ncbi:MAG: nucleotide exchange factor GrpE [Desulfovibrionaceae bacterium]
MHHKDPHEKYKQAAQMDVEESPDTTPECPVAEPNVPESVPENLEALARQYVCPTCPQKAEVDDERLRALAEMENFKKRLTREHEDQLRYAAEKVLADLLPTLDNLDLALQYGSQHEACKDMLMGVEMTRKLLLDAVRQHGLEPVGQEGEEFSPALHEGLTFDLRDDMDEGLVSTVLQRGYKLKDRLLRPAKVSISKKN